ncbi:putative ATPase/class 3 adenylate cyclase/DNA-binding SARP family transcriptional activator [Bradyrhizobium algeriense]|uniref:ATPase/class 3 adenylate cyclase/DNA-binding SARP family transcriptional activator n=1 Tax=Bradyrhizobium algeriense TaxID=634784 RepID=A0ABU8B3Q2_9BRAD
MQIPRAPMDGVLFPRFGLSLLGGFELTGPDGVVDLPSKKLAGLLAYLACNAPRPQSREKLSALLWGSRFDAQARQNLRQALFRLRKVLGEDALESDGEVVSLNAAAVRCDVSQFEALVRDGSRDALSAAADLYRGRLIDDVSVGEEGWNEWLTGERERLLDLALGAMMGLGEQDLAAGRAEQALKAGQRAIALNNMREDAHRLMVRALAATGRKAEALKHYQDLVALLKRELNTEPDAATRSLAAELRATEPPGRSSAEREIAKPTLPQPDRSSIVALPFGNMRRDHENADNPAADGDEASSAVAVGSGSPERRQLTIMVCNMVGSMPLSARLDPEDMHDLIAAFHKSVADIVSRFDGFVAQYLGDGVLVYFGYPAAGENDAEQAMRAGLAILDTIGTLKASPGVTVQVSVGIATGLVVIGERSGTGDTQQCVAIGEAPNVAAQLQAAAAPGEVVIAASTHRLAGRMFDCRALAAIDVKGLPQPVEAWQVRGETAGVSRFEVRRAGALTPLVGRQEEIELLLRRWDQAKLGEGRVVLLTGEPGIGKSRIAESLLAAREGEPHARIRYFCSPYHVQSPLYPFIAQLERAAGFEPGSSASVKLDKLEALLKPTTKNVLRDVGLIAELLGVPADERYPALAISPQQKREMTLTALLDQLDGAAARGPVMIVFEDAHWIDPTSQDLLDRMVARAASLPLLLIVTVRPELQPTWVGQPHVTMLPLSRLGRRDSAGIVGGVTKGKALPAAVVEQVLAHTDGVPLFIEELTNTLLESGLLRETTDRYVLDGPLPELAIPTTLQASLVARLDRLGSGKDVALIGSAIGREFSHELIGAVASLSPEDLDAALERLTVSGLISRRGTPPIATYAFKHALVQDAAYTTMLKSRRRQLHASIANVLVERFPALAETLPEIVAHHFTEAGLATEAIGHWFKAGQRATERSADQEAVRHLERGLALLRTLPESEDRDRHELDFQITLGTPLVAVSGYSSPEVGAASERAILLSEKLDDVGHLFAALYAQFSYCNTTGNTYKALEFAERCRTLGIRQGDRAMQLMAHRGTGIVLYQLGKFGLARKELEQSLALYDPKRDRFLAARYLTDPFASASALLASIAWISGFPDRAAKMQIQALSYAAELNHVNTIGFVHFLAGAALEQLFGNVAAVLTHTQTLSALATEHGVLAWRSSGIIFEGWALSLTSGPESGISLMQKGIADVDAKNLTFLVPLFTSLLAQVRGRAGDFQSALALCIDARERSQRSEQYIWEAELHRNEGEVRRAAGHSLTDVEECFGKALDVSRAQGARMFELRAATSLARLWHDQGRHVEARDLLAPVYGWFTEGFDTVDLEDAKALLAQLRA